MKINFIKTSEVNVTLSDNKTRKVGVSKGSIVECKKLVIKPFSVLVTVRQNNELWEIPGKDVIIKDTKNVIYPSKVRLTVPYFSQRDNKLDPQGACNVTAFAMALYALGLRGNGNGQLEDQLNQWLKDNDLDRHSHEHLQQMAIAKGFKCEFKTDAKIIDLQEHLAKGFPVVLAGWFTGSGHIITLVGYDDRGFLVHDSWGEWCEYGYEVGDTRDGFTHGAYMHYSYGLITRLCADSFGIWCHLVSK